jgi:hypothetical protein
MKAWEIWSYQPAGWPEPHPAVIISHPERVLRKPEFNVLVGSSHRAGRPAKPNEVILDQADGLDWPTICYCDPLHLVTGNELSRKRGVVTPERRTAVLRTMIACNGWV